MLRSLSKSARTLRHFHELFRRKESSLAPDTKELLQKQLQELRDAVLAGNRKHAKELAKTLEASAQKLMPKTASDKFRAFLKSMSSALLIAVLVRTMWFELYMIPTGSMRPTLKEDDYLVVSKTDYGINVPLQESHFHFDPSLVQRGSIVVFNGANIDMEDADTLYFYLFPGKKQFVKRLIGKPGDTLYFYGGKIYGLDAKGVPIDLSYVNALEHIPMIRFEGRAETSSPQNGLFPHTFFRQMGQKVAQASLAPLRMVSGTLSGKWAQYSDFLGIKHYAMARLLTKAQAEKLHNKELADAPLYLELTHHPRLQGAHMARDESNRLRPTLAQSTSLIPLEQHHIEEIANHLTTCRFSVQNGIACRLGWNPRELAPHLPRLDIPDGTYEMQDGKAYKLPFPQIPFVGLFTNGVTVELPIRHGLYSKEPELVQKLYNLGIEFLSYYAPSQKDQKLVPSRYAYFRNGDLYLLGAPILKHDDPTLHAFLKQEQDKESISTSVNPYFAFQDAGEPSQEEILKNGVKVPEKMYLVLGDNHAMSADSRHFGFVPEENLKGGVSFLFAPFGSRLGLPPQPSSPHFTLPNLAVWSAFFFTLAVASHYYRRRLQKI